MTTKPTIHEFAFLTLLDLLMNEDADVRMRAVTFAIEHQSEIHIADERLQELLVLMRDKVEPTQDDKPLPGAQETLSPLCFPIGTLVQFNQSWHLVDNRIIPMGTRAKLVSAPFLAPHDPPTGDKLTLVSVRIPFTQPLSGVHTVWCGALDLSSDAHGLVGNGKYNDIVAGDVVQLKGDLARRSYCCNDDPLAGTIHQLAANTIGTIVSETNGLYRVRIGIAFKPELFEEDFFFTDDEFRRIFCRSRQPEDVPA